MPSRRTPFEEIDRLVDRLSSELDAAGWSMGASIPLDVVDSGEAFVLTADLPGFEREEIDVSLVDSTLRIEAERETAATDEAETYLRRERSRTSLQRTVRLPEPVDAEAVTAAYGRGVLEVTLPKEEVGDGGRRIEIE